LNNYNKLENDVKQRNVGVWRPVIIAILTALSSFNDEQFQKHLESFYSPIIRLLFHEMPQDLRIATFNVLQRTGKLLGLVKQDAIAPKQTGSTSETEESTE
jgi:hypothetical protein